MVTIEVDEFTAEALERGAQQAGLTVADYVRTIVAPPREGGRANWSEIEHELAALSAAGPSLPDDFSRADIYDDHD